MSAAGNTPSRLDGGQACVCSLAKNFIDAGFTPVIDWIVPDGLDLSTLDAGGTARHIVHEAYDRASC